jgi:hypothetical protein
VFVVGSDFIRVGSPWFHKQFAFLVEWSKTLRLRRTPYIMGVGSNPTECSNFLKFLNCPFSSLFICFLHTSILLLRLKMGLILSFHLGSAYVRIGGDEAPPARQENCPAFRKADVVDTHGSRWVIDQSV